MEKGTFTTKDIQPVEHRSNHLAVQIITDPMTQLAEATDAAKALKDVLAKKKSPVMFNGEQYLEFEDWSTVASFYGVVPKTGDAEPVDIDGIKGAKAKAWLIDTATGNIVGGAEAYCLRDEKNWASKPWFQLASMAQTRAGAKALRNAFSRVVVLAGYRPTPAEEMQDVTEHMPRAAARTASAAPSNGAPAAGKITGPQAKRFWALARGAGKSDADIADYLKDTFSVDKTYDIPKASYESACLWAQAKPLDVDEETGEVIGAQAE